MFDVSPRTIYRDIDTINMAGIPIRGASGVSGGFEIMQKYKIDRKVFSTAYEGGLFPLPYFSTSISKYFLLTFYSWSFVKTCDYSMVDKTNR